MNDVRRDYGAEETSREAAALQNPEAMRGRVLAAFREVGDAGLTDHELHDLVAPGKPDGGPRNRRVDLVRLGFVVRTSTRRPSRTGVSSMIVWRAAHDDEGFDAPGPRTPKTPAAQPVPSEVTSAAWRLAEWATLTEGNGMLVLAPDYDDLFTVLAHLGHPRKESS